MQAKHNNSVLSFSLQYTFAASAVSQEVFTVHTIERRLRQKGDLTMDVVVVWFVDISGGRKMC